MIAYHVVTEHPMTVGRQIIFDENHHSGVFRRVMERKQLVEEIYADPSAHNMEPTEHHTAVALRELALEEVRRREFSDYPSRMACLYTSATIEEARQWAEYFMGLGRTVYSIVKLRIEGRCFAGNAENCFEGTRDKDENIWMARHYWEHPWTKETGGICELLVDGRITVEDIVWLPDMGS